jgi:hypothetical protein
VNRTHFTPFGLVRHAKQSRFDKLANAPNVIRHPKLHGGRNAQGFMDAAEIVVSDI